MRYLLTLSLLAWLSACTSTTPEANTQAVTEAKKAAEEARVAAEAATKKAEAAEKKLAELAPPAPAPKPAPATPQVLTIAAGTPVAVRTTSLITSKTARVGETFAASLEQPLLVGGAVVAPQGANATLRVTSVDPGGRVKGRATLGLTLVSVTGASGRVINLSTGTFVKEAPSGVKKDVLKTGIASGVGAAIGAIAGGGKGAAIGAGAGAAGGTGVVLATRGPAAEVPSESVLQFALGRAVSVPR